MMGLITTNKNIKTTNKNITYYKQFYTNIKSGDIINVDINKLSHGCKETVSVECDSCKKINSMMYKTYILITNNNEYFCNKCKNKKTKQTCINKYGVENVFQSKEIKEKSKETCRIKYNSDYYQQTSEYKEKCKNTCLEKYGHEHHMQNKDICDKVVDKNKDNRIESTIKMINTKNNIYSIRFDEIANNIHNNKYVYVSKYIDSINKIEIYCPIHGIFEQRPKDHIHNKQGCPLCKTSKGETKIINILSGKNIRFDYQKIFDDCKNINHLPFDFYLTDYNTCIEFDGEQHFRIIEYFGGLDGYNNRRKNDDIKTNYCINKGIKLLRIRYNDIIEEKLKEIWD